MHSENLDSEIFANLQQQQEILLWRYATETGSFKKKMIGARMLLSKLKGSLMASFYSAAQVNDIRNRNLANAVMTARSLSPWQTVKRTFAMERTIRKWEQAKAANDFTIVQDELQSLVDSIRIEARSKAAMMGVDEPYDALLRSRTQGLSTAYFDWLTECLPTFCYIVRKQARSLQAPAYPQAIFEDKALDQDKLERMVLQTIGYDLDRGRVAQALHPLCMGMHDDVRIGVRASKDFTTTILTAGHEGGHGTYRQNLPVLYNRLDSGLAGVGMDEAMALIMENHVVRDKPFADFIAKTLREDFNAAASAEITGDMLHRHMKHIKDAPIRTEADEIRYPLDVILRYRIERQLINGEMDVADIPEYWRSEYRKLTGIEIKIDNEGPLQDIHWFAGEFGWFPNYLVGQMAAAQLFEVASDDMPFLKHYLAKGNVAPLRNWLHEKIYSQGATQTINNLVQSATGAPIGPIAYMRHIGRRYTRKDESNLDLKVK